MSAVIVNARRPYRVEVESGILNRLGDMLKSELSCDTIALISDETAGALYAEPVRGQLESAGFRTVEYLFPPGETEKTLSRASEILEFLAESRLSRADCVLALGGGIPGDLAGFCAAVYLRGVDFINLPTTLLSMVDSSVGGKTGVNLSSGKNLAGAFRQPRLVICDPDALKTLPRKIFSDGMAEVIKYGVLCDRELFDKTARGVEGCDMEEIITRCVSHKADFTAADELDTGERQKLNLGHTAGHAIEKCSGYGISHGEAVAIGMVIAARAAETLGVAEPGTAAEIKDALIENKLPTSTDIPMDKLLGVMGVDKKRSGKSVNIILPRRIGECVIRPTDIGELKTIFGDF